jgi:hypothetical protein
MMLFKPDDGGEGNEDDGREQVVTGEEIKDELAAMADSLGAGATPKVKEPKEIDLDMTGDEEKKETPPVEAEEEKVEAKPAEEEKPVEKDGEKKEEEKKPDETEQMRNDFNEFAATQLKAAGITVDGSLAPPPAEAKPTKEKKEEEVQKPAEEVKPAIDAFKPIDISDEAFDEIKNDPAKFAEFFNNYARTLRAALREEILFESVTTSRKFVEQYTNSLDAVRTFYSDNKPLDKYRPVVGFISTKLAQEHPDWTRDNLMKETAKEAYRLLRLEPGKQPPDNGAESDKAEVQPPGFGKTGARRGQPGEKIYKNKIAKELADMAPQR